MAIEHSSTVTIHNRVLKHARQLGWPKIVLDHVCYIIIMFVCTTMLKYTHVVLEAHE